MQATAIPQQVLATPGQTFIIQHPVSALSSNQAAVQTVPVQTSLGQPERIGYSERFNGQAGRGTGWIQLCCGVASILAAVAQLLLESPVRFSFYGIWAGAMIYGPSGLLGIYSFRRRTCIISTYMAMSIVSSCIAFVMMCMGAISAPISTALGCYPSSSGSGCQPGFGEGRVASDAILAVIGLIELIVSIVASVYCCGGVCCGSSTTTLQQTSVVTHYPAVISPGGNQAMQCATTDQPPPYASIQPGSTYQSLLQSSNSGQNNLTVQLPNN